MSFDNLSFDKKFELCCNNSLQNHNKLKALGYKLEPEQLPAKSRLFRLSLSNKYDLSISNPLDLGFPGIETGLCLAASKYDPIFCVYWGYEKQVRTFNTFEDLTQEIDRLLKLINEQ